MKTQEILSLITLITTALIGSIGFILTIYQIKKANKVKHAEFISELLQNIRLNEQIVKATYLIDYSDHWYNNSFHGGSETEKNIDALFSQLDYICYLYYESLLNNKDFSIFKYEMMRVCNNFQCQAYLWNLYHWSHNECSYNNLIKYLKSQFPTNELKIFEKKEELKYPKHLNF